MKTLKDLKYTKTHEWVRQLGEGIIEVGLTDYAQDSLGDLVFVNLPEQGDRVDIGDSLGDVESVKAVSDVYSPASGSITEINELLLDNPDLINEDPYGAWLVRIETEKIEELLSAEEYEELVSKED